MARKLKPATRLADYRDPTLNDPPVGAEVTLHDPDGAEFLMNVWVGRTQDVVPAAEYAVELRKLDLGVSDWRPL